MSVPKHWLVWLLIVSGAAGSSRAACALVFEQWTDRSGTVLIIRDCKNFTPDYIKNHNNNLAKFFAREDNHDCMPWESHLSGPYSDDQGRSYPGDAVALEYEFAQARTTGTHFAEVWLFSGGGDVGTALKMAKTLRREQAAVRLPEGFRCISACTLCFMGGYFRYMDEGAFYQVHSASGVESGIDQQQKLNEVVKRVAKNPEQELTKFAGEELILSHSMAMCLLTLFQTTLDIPLHVRPRTECGELEDYESNRGLPQWDYLQNASLPARDAALIKTEGIGAVQDVLMRIEREAMAASINQLGGEVSQLGPRAAPAIEMLKLMYMTSIKDTSVLSHYEMVQRGYLTQEFHP